MNLLNKLLNPLEIIKTFTFFVDGGIGETALAGEALSGMDLAADAGIGAGNAIGGGALATGLGSGAAVSGMDLAADAGIGANNAIGSNALANMPFGPGTPTGPAINAANTAVNEANLAARAASPYALTGATAPFQAAGSMANTLPSLQGGSMADSLGSLQGNASVLANSPSLASTYAAANSALAPGLGLNPALGQAGFNAGMANAASPGIGSGLMGLWNSLSNSQKIALGGAAGLAALSASGSMNPKYMNTFTPQTANQVGLGRTLSPQYTPVRPAAEGGVMHLAAGGMPGQQYPMSQINYNGYNTPTQMPTTALNMAGYQPNNTPLAGALNQNMASGGTASASAPIPVSPAAPTPSGITAAGEMSSPNLSIWSPSSSNSLGSQLSQLASQYGVNLPTSAADGGIMGLSSGGAPGYNLGGYSDGGRLLKGPGDGMSDDIPASIADKQPARLADGEFVIPSDVVSHLGNGSTDAGAKHLYDMMDRVRKARTGHTRQGKQIEPNKYMPA